MTRFVKAAVAVAACAGLLASCSSSGGAPSSSGSSGSAGSDSSSAGSSGNVIEVKNFSFTPSALTVSKGTTVTWKFDDSANHNVTASNNAFASKDLHTGGSYSYTFNSTGTYNYICSIHQYMHGSVTVK